MNLDGHSTRRNISFFLDTYALVEIFIGNENYLKYFDKAFAITKLNLFEFHQYLVKAKGESIADSIIEYYLPNIADFDINIIRLASKFRTRNMKKNVSMTDCIGYIFAKENGLLFVTGDKEFSGLDNVEFVK